MQSTIRDVAEEAGVSVATVSRVFNAMSNVSDSTREKVEAAAAKLRYVPNASARMLSRAKSDTIGILLPDFHGEFFSNLLRGMDEAARMRRVGLMITSIGSDRDRAIEAIKSFRGRVDGLVIMPTEIGDSDAIRALVGDQPTLFISPAWEESEFPSVRINNYAVAREIVEHLVQSGRTRIAHIAGPLRNADASERRRAYGDVLRAHGYAEIVYEGTFFEEAGAAAAQAILAEGCAIDALFAANDLMAFGAMRTLIDAGIGVPDRIAIAGFDDAPWARFITPGLTTAGLDVRAMGRLAIEQLCDGIAGHPAIGTTVIEPVMIVRSSTDHAGSGRS